MKHETTKEKTTKQKALDYHANGKPGKISIVPHKELNTQEDLALAYSPGVAEPVLAIAENPEMAYKYTNKGSLVAIISNGTAILGLGNKGALASKPVMEGKAVLFKKFAGVDAIDIEVDTENVEEFIQTVKNIAPSFGGINLEDIKAPECFEIEKRLIDELDIPVFHDDQHGTAIIIAAGLINACEVAGKNIDEVKITCIGAGSAGIATLNLLLEVGFNKDNILLVDREGVIHPSDKNSPQKQRFASNSTKNTLAEAMDGCDIFIGLASANLVSKEMVKSMAANPIIFALSNPTPEISPEDVKSVRDDAIIATGRSDYPNQVNNVLGFPFIFKGALKARARYIDTDMKKAAVYALCKLTKLEVEEDVKELYKSENLVFGRDYIIPKPFDARLDNFVSGAVFDAYQGNTAK
jgi:malate dehydrogenase (oxaloacetate-decarboxylating)(NADP+)